MSDNVTGQLGSAHGALGHTRRVILRGGVIPRVILEAHVSMFFAYEGVIDHHVAQPLAKCLWLSTIKERERRVRRVAWHEQHSALQRQWLQHLPVRRRSWVFRARVDLLAEWDGAVAQERPQRAGLARTESIERGRVCPPGRRGRSVESRGRGLEPVFKLIP